jgi:hypothetical protein
MLSPYAARYRERFCSSSLTVANASRKPALIFYDLQKRS